MLYLGFLAIGLGILSTVSGLICLAIASFSQEILIRNKTKKLAGKILPVAVVLLLIGTGVVGYLFEV
nr:hypothetical protein [uncultured Moraxella sp.]